MLVRASPWQSAQALARRAGLAVPQLLAVEHPQHAGIGGVVVLHRLGVRRHEAVAGPALGLRDFGGASDSADMTTAIGSAAND